MGYQMTASEWCRARTPEQWQQVWESHYSSLRVAQHYWLAYRSFPEEMTAGVSPCSWGYDPTVEWETLLDAFWLACCSSERRFLMNDALWGIMLVFPLVDYGENVPVVKDEERLEVLLGLGVGDHAFRGELMWNLVSEDRVMPEDVSVAPGEMDEFLHRYPTDRAWIEARDKLCSRDPLDSHSYDLLPSEMQCSVGVLAYLDDWYGGSTWSQVVAAARRKSLSASRSRKNDEIR